MNESIIKAAIENYSKMSDEQLMAELTKLVAKQKQNDGGSSMRKMIERIMPLLNEEQQRRFKEIFDAVNG